ncbi:MAG: 30S ribosomal protein S17 [Planctomycetota bacterium]
MTGVVTSDKMAKTIVVRVERRVKDPLYGKYVRRFTTLKVHDPEQTAKAGDRVEVEFTRPLSKTKRWRLVRVVRPSRGAPLEALPEVLPEALPGVLPGALPGAAPGAAPYAAPGGNWGAAGSGGEAASPAAPEETSEARPVSPGDHGGDA